MGGGSSKVGESGACATATMKLLSVELFLEEEARGGGEEGRDWRPRNEKNPDDRLAKEGDVGGDSLMDGRRRLGATSGGGAMEVRSSELSWEEGRKGRRRRKEDRVELELNIERSRERRL